MGIISHYQRKQLASQAVGVAPIDKSGEILAQGINQFATGVTKYAANLQERQNTLDTLSATKSFYDFAQKDAIVNAQLQIDYQDNPQGFMPAYEEQSSTLSQEVGGGLEGNSKFLFDEMVSKYKARKAIKDGEWIFNQQNRNALNTATELGAGFVNTAMTLTNSEEYMGLVDTFKETVETSIKSVVSPKGYTQYKDKVNKNMALSYLGAQKTTDPVGLENELKQNTPFTQHLRKVLGEKGFLAQVNQVKKFRKQFISDLGFETIVNGKQAAVDALNTLMTNPSAFSYAKAEQGYITTVNIYNKMKEDNKVDGRYAAAIPAQEKMVKAFSYIKQIAANIGDQGVHSDIQAVSDITTEIKDIQESFKGVPKEYTSVSRQELALGAGVSIGMSAIRTKARANTAGGVAVGANMIGTEAREKTASNAYSKYVEKMYEVQNKITELRANRQINNKDFEMLIKKMAVPLSEANEFNRMTDGNGIGFDVAWNTFDAFARNIYGEGKDKDFARTEMLKNYMSEVMSVKDMDATPDSNFMALAINLQKQKLLNQIHPKLAGVVKGDMVEYGGRQVEFVGYDMTTGKPLGKIDARTKVELDNL